MTTIRQILPVVAAGLLTATCGKNATTDAAGGGGGGGGGPPVAGIALPSEVSALPTKTAGAAARLAPRGLAALPGAGTDYDSAPARKYVNERALSQFDILNTIFGAVAQTHYADPENVNQGPYQAMVSWTEDQGKKVIPWVVDSSLIQEAGTDVNLVKVWMLDTMGDGQLHLIKVSLRIYQAPVRNPDGSYADYGVWRLDAKFDDAATGYFVARAQRGLAGESVIEVHQLDRDGEVRGVLHRSADSGYGKVTFPDWDSCGDGGCTTPPPATVSYVYDAAAVAIEKVPQAGPTLGGVKDRAHPVDMVNRYALFDAVTGDDVARHHAFGFPFRYQGGSGEMWGNYGAWQGRHQVWANGQTLAPGTSVTRADVPGPTAPSYTVSQAFSGVLVRRTLVEAGLSDVQDTVLNTWMSQQVNLTFDGSLWTTCVNPDWSTSPPTCQSSTALAEADLGSIYPAPGDPTQNAWIQVCMTQGGTGGPPPQLVFDPVGSGGQGPGLYVATSSPGMPPVSSGQKYLASQGDQVCSNVNGQIWVVWDGADWWKKKVVSLDPQTYIPTFDPGQDSPFALDANREYYFSAQGVNFVVVFDGVGGYAVQIERQTVGNPVNAADFAAGKTFRRPWGDTVSELVLDTVPGSPTFLELKYLTVGPQDQQAGAHEGDLITSGIWGLRAYVSGVAQGDQYNWDYPSQPGDTWATQQFLVRGDGSYLILDDAIRLQPVQLADRHGNLKTYALQFDGNWVGGLPDVWNDLRGSGYQMTDAIADELVVIPDGTAVSDGTSSYLFRAVEVQEFLPVLPSPPAMSLTPASDLSLAAMPSFQDEQLGDLPVVPVKYSEGQPVQ